MTIKSAIVGDEAFIQGEFLSIGINRDGGIGTRAAAPTGFYSDKEAGFLRVGMLADLDGFGKGQEGVLSDALMFGRTIEGFNLGYKMGGTTITHQNQSLTGYSDIAGVTGATSDKGQIGWKGSTTEKLAVAQKVTLLDDASFVRIDVTLTNNSASAMADVRYMRTADPDQEGKFATTNTIVRQGDAGALVSSSFGANGSFFLFSEDSRAIVSTFGFVNTDPYAPAAFNIAQSQGFTRTADETVNITFGLGTLNPGASTMVTMYIGVTKDLAKTVARIEAGGPSPSTPPVNLAPIVTADSLILSENGFGKGNVLANDRDPEGAKLTAGLKTGPMNGSVSLLADGNYTYTPKAGFIGKDQFTYVASDGANATSANVTLTVKAMPITATSPLITRAGTQDGSSSSNQTMTGPAYHNTFFFDVAAVSGSDLITNFGNDDILVVNRALYDGNGDGRIELANGRLSIDSAKLVDTAAITGISALRLIGTDPYGMVVYGNASVRPDYAIEGMLGNDRLSGDSLDLKKETFFFDTALDINLGADQIVNFGKGDIFVTTSELLDGNGDGYIGFGDGRAKLVGGSGAAGDVVAAGEVGSVALFAPGGNGIAGLEYDGAVTHDGTTYFVYSAAGSLAGVADLVF